MPRLGLDMCLEIMLPFVENGRKQVKQAELEHLITIHSGGTDPRTLKNYKKTMIRLGWIKPVSLTVFEINKKRITSDANIRAKTTEEVG